MATLALGSLSGCGDDSADTRGSAESSSPVESSSPLETPSDSQSGSPTAAGGTEFQTGEFAYGETVVVGYEDWMATDSSAKPIAVMVDVTQGKITDLSDFNLDAQTKGGVPFYLHYSVENRAPKKQDFSGFSGAFTVTTSSGDPAGRLTLLGEFGPCEGTPADTLAPGKKGEGCDVYVLPKGQTIQSVTMPSGAGDVTWQ